eukprot:CAMPEP_0177585376 /NCGR_PEP_ID=MMETSP0419_2-20121207/4457_1 /TAXON_ID=582737 /ORGANISM="Tetraselmis sp., Strain GSL018" /LENGTH=182 /DNA_ID=CAMNT_0019075099 /DNA_START=107 /DNA_END=652 /DNA_ORIENTATION=+
MVVEESRSASRPVVVARLRPRWQKEKDERLPLLASVDAKASTVYIKSDEESPPKAVKVTHALDERAEQDDVWAVFSPCIDELLDRINISLFAYGETGSGKTYTMSYLTSRFICEVLRRKQEYDSFEVVLSMVEIDNERIYDLLGSDRKNLTILNYEVKGSKWAEVRSEAECKALLQECWRRR